MARFSEQVPGEQVWMCFSGEWCKEKTGRTARPAMRPDGSGSTESGAVPRSPQFSRSTKEERMPDRQSLNAGATTRGNNADQ